MSYTFFIAKRLYAHKNEGNRVSRPAIHIATAGVAIGLAVMIVSVCVVLGFKHEISAKVKGFGAHIEVINYNTLRSTEPQPIVTNDSLLHVMRQIKGIKHVQRFCNKLGILKTDEDFKGMMLKGIGPEYDESFLKKNMVTGELPQFSDTISSNKIVVSQMIANKLGLKVGDKVFAYFFSSTIRARRFTVAGIYRTNMTEFDNSLVITDIYTTNHLNGFHPDQTSGLEMTVNDYSKLTEIEGNVISNVNRAFDKYGEPYVTMSIEELYPQIFAWLDLLDLNVWVILGLMICVAGFTMISGLLIIILERTNFIGVMKALGATNRSIRHIFLHFAVFIIGRGVLWGNIIGIGIVYLQWQFGIFHLNPATYYVDTVPVLFNGWLLLILNVATLIISVLVLIIPSFLISNIHPAKSIRYE